MTEDRLLISFSGGRTSGYLTERLLFEHPAKHKIIVFANTGQEDERTLQFVFKCSILWNVEIIWVEAVVNLQRGEATTHKIVDFWSACRDESIFEAVIKKYGIPNTNFPHCTRELKLQPITSFVRSIGWKKGTYETAIGIRADEIDRMRPDAKEAKIIYPLIKWNIKKPDILAFWRRQPFNLDLPEHRGNCVWCWKKSLRKHLTLARETPHIFSVPNRFEQEYANAGAGEGPRVFFRKKMKAADILKMSTQPFEQFTDPEMDVGGACGESCEIYADGDDPTGN